MNWLPRWRKLPQFRQVAPRAQIEAIGEDAWLHRSEFRRGVIAVFSEATPSVVSLLEAACSP